METTWIVVAHRSGARLFSAHDHGNELNLEQEIDFPEGHLKNREIDSDRPGRSFDRRGAGRHAVGDEDESRAHLAEQFAKTLSSMLEEGRTHHRYSRLVLVAEPGFLGTLRASLDPQTTSMVAATVGKDLANVDAPTMKKQLSEIAAMTAA